MRLVGQAELTERLPHIDGLRAVAVLAVIIFHAFPDLLPGGALGVDVFFVISGYVITLRLLAVARRSGGRLTGRDLVAFYARRMRRLLPALALCILISAAALAVFTPNKSTEVFRTGGWAALGVSNIRLYFSQTDYFALDAHLNLFTHTWSLGVEEQIYLAFPLLLMLSAAAAGATRVAFRWTIFTSVLSLIAYLVLSAYQPSAAFYLSPARFWQFGLGAALAMRPEFNARAMALAGMAGLMVVFSWRSPGDMLPTMLATLAAGAVVAGGSQAGLVTRALNARPAQLIGAASYSLYLWHWPLLVLARWTVGDSVLAVFVCLILTFMVSWMSYRHVERAFIHRYSGLSFPRVVILGLAVMTSTFLLVSTQGPRVAKRVDVSLAHYWGIAPAARITLARQCHGEAAISKLADPLRFCLSGPRSAERPKRLYLLGDSHAHHLTPMVDVALKETNFDWKFINTESEEDPPECFYTSPSCSSNVIEFVKTESRPGDVLLLSFHHGSLNDERSQHLDLHAPAPQTSEYRNAMSAAPDFVHQFSRRGVHVILALDTPMLSGRLPVETCAVDQLFRGVSRCAVSKSVSEHTRTLQRRVVEKAAAGQADVSIWDAAAPLYDEAQRFDALGPDGILRMIDLNHLSEDGALELAPSFAEHFQRCCVR